MLSFTLHHWKINYVRSNLSSRSNSSNYKSSDCRIVNKTLGEKFRIFYICDVLVWHIQIYFILNFRRAEFKPFRILLFRILALSNFIFQNFSHSEFNYYEYSPSQIFEFWIISIPNLVPQSSRFVFDFSTWVLRRGSKNLPPGGALS